MAPSHPHADDQFAAPQTDVHPTPLPLSTDGLSVKVQAAFQAALQQVGQLSPQAFAQRYSSHAHYLPQLSWDPTTAQFWQDFHCDPSERQQQPSSKQRRPFDFRLTERELAVFKRQGFVVSERLGGQSFSELFYRLYSNDLPVFVSADAILHAWHRSYDAVLEELEANYLFHSLTELLQGMAEHLPAVWQEYGNGPLRESLQEVDYFLAVTRSLLLQDALSPQPNPALIQTVLGQEQRVIETLTAIGRAQLEAVELFGQKRTVDYSQFKPRGHYENSDQLKRYFRGMMWCGTIDFRLAGTATTAFPRELGAAVVLYHLLQLSDKFEQWQQFDELLQTFVGQSDSLTFAHLDQLLADANLQTLDAVEHRESLVQLQARLTHASPGGQAIAGHPYDAMPTGQPSQLPAAFTLMGQKFVLDSWVLAQVVFDRLQWHGEKIQRRIPTCLDVAFAALANDQVVPNLVAAMTNAQGHPLRDGLPYQHNLAALRQAIDALDDHQWEDNLYLCWLATLRTLSAPTTSPEYPETMRTRAWAMKTLNTQLASWTQLRHDTILYVKQSQSFGITCCYPAGFVEPRLDFWACFEKMAVRAAALLQRLVLPTQQLQWQQQRQVQFFQNFAQQLAVLKELARKELAQEPFSETELQFLQTIVEVIHLSSGGPTYTGWYFGLFYKRDYWEWDAIVADVHTDLPADALGDSGCVLHEAIGNVNMLVLAVENGADRMVYAGPVLSHYEFSLPGLTRLADSEWKATLQKGKLPLRPAWQQSYLVPKERAPSEGLQ
ncbi:MAG: DUF3160 domain-containing protein (plasmid) [Leptolyngbya sp. BL-A-14]